MTRISFGIIALNAQPFLEYNLRALYPFAHQIIVVEGAVRAAASLATEDGHSTDGTLEMLKRFQSERDPDQKLEVVSAKGEGYADGFWPEKDEMSQAYAKRATGDWLWQVDSDEFYLEADMRAVTQMLDDQPQISGISFPFFEFWGGFEYLVSGKWYLQEFTEVPRLFRWGPGYQYRSHRPPSVVDQNGRPLEASKWLSGAAMRRLGIFMYHYSYTLPKQAEQKVGYYSNVTWTEAYRQNQRWYEDAFQRLKHPLFLNERGWPILQWLERFRGEHPQVIKELKQDLESGRVKEALRPVQDIERLLRSPWYWLVTRLLRLVMSPYWRIRRALRRKPNA